MSLFFIDEVEKLRHSLDRPSRSDFVRSEFVEMIGNLTNWNLEGYTFALIYSDTEKGNPTNATVGTTAITGDYYIVMPGDTLSSIAIRSGKTVNYLANINNIENINFLRVGQKIQLK